MDKAGATDGDETPEADDEAAPDELRRQLTQAITERNQIAQLLKHEAESARLVIAARDAAEGRVAELEGIKPRAARKLGEAQALDAERAAREELEARVTSLTEAQDEAEQAHAAELATANERVTELEPALEKARSGWGQSWKEVGVLNKRLEESAAAREQLQGERDAAQQRVAEITRSLAETDDGIAMLERALESVSGERDRIETARGVLEARLITRDEAERVLLAEREAEHRTARAHRLQLTRVERRLMEVAGAMNVAVRRLEAPPGAPAAQTAGAAGVSAPRDAALPAPRTLASGFLRSAEVHPDRPALEVAGETYGFADLRERAARIAATLQRETPTADPALTAVFAHRSATAFTGLLGTLMRGHGYVPLNRTLPVARTRTMLQRAGCEALIVDAESARQLPELLGTTSHPLVVLLPELDDISDLRQALPAHRLLGASDLEPASAWRPPPVDTSAIAYLLFTSGSTGVPKGVMVAHRNALHYIDALVERYAITERDRFSQTHDLTFDNSILDIFVAWERGACVCCPGQRTLMNPGGYIRESRLTVWFSVPSVAMFMRRLGGCKPDSYPDLRWSLFAGEPLPMEIVRAWEQAAPHSTIENLYGPTETTVDVTVYRWNASKSPSACEHGILPIGHPLPDIGVLIADEQLREVAPGEVGELLVSGPQVTLGYWRDPERTAASYVMPPGRKTRHYRTGDLVRRPREPDGPIVFLGRRDEQIKVRGVRIELGEVECALREVSGVDAVAALGWPLTLVGADGVEAFIGSDEVDAAAVRAALGERLPGHMVPRRVRGLAQLPLNANGKIDRPALVRLLEAE